MQRDLSISTIRSGDTRPGVPAAEGRVMVGFVRVAAAVAWMGPLTASANPEGPVVQQGSASFATSGNHLQVTAGHNAVIDWRSFNLAPGDWTSFVQPAANAVVWNRILDTQPSRIDGSIDANGVLVLMNSAGFQFGTGAFVQAAGLVVTTAPLPPVESGAGLFWQFNGAPPSAAIVNYGVLRTTPGGAAFLIADRIENHGTIAAPGGTVGLAAGDEVLLSERPDGRGLSAQVRMPAGSIDNSGRVVADAGTIALQARVVNQTGQIQANAVRERNGVIELYASDSLTLGPGSDLRAEGGTDPAASADGGRIGLKSDREFRDDPASTISVAGRNGGTVAVSAVEMRALRSRLQAEGGAGGEGGRLIIDPTDIVLANSGDGSAGSGSVPADSPPTTLTLDVNTAFAGFSRIELQATRNISLAPGVTWDLAASTGVAEPGSSLKLEAGNTITLPNGTAILAPDHWSITLQAGRDFGQADAVRVGTGSIVLSGNALIETRDGDIHLLAGNSITVGTGAIRTVAGGSIEARAVGGSVNTGTRPNGYQFRPTGYVVDAELGGISTAAGGDVRLEAGLDVTSYLPLAGGQATDGGSGAFGEQAGNVVVKAGRDVAGHFVVRNGTGTIEAGRNAGTPTRLLALSLVKGGWSVSAEQDVLLQEIRNPNGIFNNLGSSSSPNRHRFDYSPEAYAVVRGGHSVQLRGTALPRYSDVFSQGMPPIYPGRLGLEAGAGGVVLANDVVLFPSPLGSLDVTTTDGGGLVGTRPGDLTQFVLSDSGRVQYRAYGDFGIADHAAVPLHLGDADPVRLSIAGNVSGILLGLAKRAEITVGGNLVNSRLEEQNLGAGDVTRLVVAGDIVNRNEFTSVPMAAAPDFSAFTEGLIYPAPSGGLVGLETRFSYNASTKSLTFQGRMTGDQRQLLLGAPVQVFDATGSPLFQPNGEPVTRTVALLPPEVVEALYTASQDIPLNPDTGYRLGGPGRFEIRARNLDLGATAGIVSQGPRANPALAQLATRGADLDIRLTGDLDMFSTQIATMNGGSIDILAGGAVRAGSRDFTSGGGPARGIFTVDDSDVTVVARGDINVSGSRIAAYDGGNVTVRSLEGDVDAGTGGGGSATVEKIVVDPVTRHVRSYSPTIPGSGILATTFPPSLDASFPASVNAVGDILVETPRGDIVASAGGVVQIPLNGVSTSAGTVTLRAGTRDAQGQVVYAGDIDASGSGVIGSTVKLEASGSIKGLVFARENIDVSAVRNVNVTALAQGNVNVSASGTVSGTIIGVGSVTAAGAGGVDAALLSQNVTTSGDTGGAQVGFGQGSAANATSQSLPAEDSAKTVAAAESAEAGDGADGPGRKRKTEAPRLTRSVGRVTVILPGSEEGKK